MARILNRTALTTLAAGMAVATAPAFATSGEAVFRSDCSVCHANTKAANPKIGPNLFAVGGRKAGSLPGYQYSSAMKKAGFEWTEANLDAYIQKPQAKVPGDKMPYPGMSDAAKRKALVTYLLSLR